MAGDQPGKPQEQPPAAAIDFNAIINAGTRGHMAPDALQQARDQARPPATPQDIKIGTDATNTVVISNKTVELSVKDPNFDSKLNYAASHAGDKFEQIKIDDLPANTQIKTWMDKNGYFFWYDDGTQTPKQHHYLPENVLGMRAGNWTRDMEDERLKTNQVWAQTYMGSFRSFDRDYVPQRDGTTNSTSYYWQMAGAPAAALDIQEHALRESVRSSDNPYFKIYLSDVLAAQAIKPVRDRAEHGLSTNPNNEYTRKKIDDALSVSNAAWLQTKGELAKYNQFPALNQYLELAPHREFWSHDRNPNDWMGFWGGGFNQSYGRDQALTSLRGLVMSGVIPKVHPLPPVPPLVLKDPNQHN